MTDTVIGLLVEIKEVYSKIFDLSQQKQQLLIANKAEEISDVLKEEWGLLSEASELENKRVEAAEALFPGKNGEDITIDDIAAIASPEEKKHLLEVSGELYKLLEDQKKLNAENQSLIELHLEYMDYMVNVVLKDPQVSNIYGNSGIVEEPAGGARGVIDSEA